MTSTNNTLFNNRSRNRPPDWRNFDAFEIDCCASVVACDGTAWTERVPIHEAEFFTVFGHLKRGGTEAITDVSTRKLAHQIANLFREMVSEDCAIFDVCDSEPGGFRVVPSQWLMPAAFRQVENVLCVVDLSEDSEQTGVLIP